MEGYEENRVKWVIDKPRGLFLTRRSGTLRRARVATRSEAIGNQWQYRSTDVMGYRSLQYSPMLPLKDFFSWQIPTIRQRINEQINKK